MKRIGFIGFGRMGNALVKGALAAGVLKKNQILVYDPDVAARRSSRSLGVKSVSDIDGLVQNSAFIFLCIKPQQMDFVLDEVKLALLAKKSKGKCFVSIAAGIPLARIKKKLGDGISLFRVMPNTPALLGAGMSGLSRGPNATPAQEKAVKAVLEAVGEVITVPESFMDAVTAISGSGPAYVFYLAEALIRGAASVGLGPDLARRLVHQTVYGAGLMLKKRSEPAEELRRQVTSPGGTTAAAIAEFDKENFKKIVDMAVVKAAQRSAELAKI